MSFFLPIHDKLVGCLESWIDMPRPRNEIYKSRTYRKLLKYVRILNNVALNLYRSKSFDTFDTSSNHFEPLFLLLLNIEFDSKPCWFFRMSFRKLAHSLYSQLYVREGFPSQYYAIQSYLFHFLPVLLTQKYK